MKASDVIYAETDAVIEDGDEEQMRDLHYALQDASDRLEHAQWELTSDDNLEMEI